METNLKNFGEGVKAFGRVCSVAFRQARQSEIDVLSKGRIRERYEGGEESSTHRRHTSAREKERFGRVSDGLRTARRCWTEAGRQAAQSEVDVLERRRFQAFHNPGGSGGAELEEPLPEEGKDYPYSSPGQAAHSLQGSC